VGGDGVVRPSLRRKQHDCRPLELLPYHRVLGSLILDFVEQFERFTGSGHGSTSADSRVPSVMPRNS
jgi:hypothetical protein